MPRQLRRECTHPQFWFDSDEHTRVAIELAKSINRPELAAFRSAHIWLYVVGKFVELMQSQHYQWSFGKVTHAPESEYDLFSATIVLTFKDTTLTAEIGLSGPSCDWSAWMALDELGRVVKYQGEGIDIQGAVRGVVGDMKSKIHERHLELAWNAGNPDSTRTRSRNAWVDWDEDEIFKKLQDRWDAEQLQ